MIVVIKDRANEESIEKLREYVSKFGIKTVSIVGEKTTIYGLVGDTSVLDMDTILSNEAVDRVIKVQEPYKHSNRKFHPEDTVVDVNGVKIGGRQLCVIAGPCSVESREQILKVAQDISKSGARVLRGGAFKPRTSPYSFQGLKAEGLELMQVPRKQLGIPIVSEITNPATLDIFLENVDIIQVGARNMQNFELLKLLGQINKPVLLKRGFSNTIEELLMSAEYIMNGGNGKVILCERGIRTFEHFTRNTLDISAVPALKRLSHLPVIVDPSHSSGINWLVEPLALAAVAAGAAGVMVEVHNCPSCALCDGPQSLSCGEFDSLMGKLKKVAEAVGRRL
ncbi:MAG: 3-deoxy-7-phosphoheptulonate synthase [Clostridiales bacterium]|jgi:3-deoxy-7-phosphoheptulonate synthase|nr:3-deoxy-7-phosphoheptulonate synthase [Clostridiales bacterium]